MAAGRRHAFCGVGVSWAVLPTVCFSSHEGGLRSRLISVLIYVAVV